MNGFGLMTLLPNRAKAGDRPGAKCERGFAGKHRSSVSRTKHFHFCHLRMAFPTPETGPDTGATTKGGSPLQGQKISRCASHRHQPSLVPWSCRAPRPEEMLLCPVCRLGKRLLPAHPTDPSQHHKKTPTPPPATFPVFKHGRRFKTCSWTNGFRQDTALMAQHQSGGESRCHDTDISVM